MRPHRKERVASVIREIVSDAIAHKINDPRLAPLATVSRVVVSGDMSVATIFLTFIGDPAVERRSMSALRHATGFVRRLVAEQLEVRQCPEIRFEIDESAKKLREMMRILDENRRLEPHLYENLVAGSDEKAERKPVVDHGADDRTESKKDDDPAGGGGE